LSIKLTDIKQNQEGVINDVLDNPLISKMLEFGLLPGAAVKVVNIAPFKGPISILIGNSRIAIRQREAEFVLIDC
jgi:ferrous iron transport protein A